jgi:hypothetical protein
LENKVPMNEYTYSRYQYLFTAQDNYDIEYSETSIHHCPMHCFPTSIINFFWSLHIAHADNAVTEIQAWLKAGNRCYYALQALFKSRRISRIVKLNTVKPR